MTPASTMQTTLVNRDILAVLGRLYGGKGLQRDAFGRRIALPSEIARTLARDAGDSLLLAGLTSQPGRGMFHATTYQQDASEV